jgi:hypothetical protein
MDDEKITLALERDGHEHEVTVTRKEDGSLTAVRTADGEPFELTDEEKVAVGEELDSGDEIDDPDNYEDEDSEDNEEKSGG